MMRKKRASPAPMSGFLTTTQAASAIGVHPSTIKRLIEDGMLECWRTPGGHRRITLDSAQEFLRVNLKQSVVHIRRHATAIGVLDFGGSALPLKVLVAQSVLGQAEALTEFFYGRSHEVAIRRCALDDESTPSEARRYRPDLVVLFFGAGHLSMHASAIESLINACPGALVTLLSLPEGAADSGEYLEVLDLIESLLLQRKDTVAQAAGGRAHADIAPVARIGSGSKETVGGVAGRQRSAAHAP